MFSKCGRCRRYMHFIALRPQRLHCRTCNQTYSLPQGGNIKVSEFTFFETFKIFKVFKELTCPLDQFELVLFSTGSKGKGFPVCPQCYNDPPFPNVGAGMGCNKCPDERCPNSFTRNWVCECPEFKCTGKLVLDATSAPRWKVTEHHFH